MSDVRVLVGDCRARLAELEAGSVQTCVTSPPYFWARDYGVDGQLGMEPTPREYVTALVGVFREVWRVLRDDGTCWINLGDSYCTRSVQRADGMRTVVKAFAGEAEMPSWSDYAAAGNARYSSSLKGEGLKDKDLIGIPWRVAFALQDDGWYLRSEIIWSKPNCMPESVQDRPTRSHETIFLLSKSERYYYDAEAIAEPAGPFKPAGPQSRMDNDRDPAHGTKKQDAVGNRRYAGFNERWRDNPTTTRNKRSVWTVSPRPYADAHFATYPPQLIEPCILAGSRPGDVVLDPFAGSGTTLAVAIKHRRRAVGVELNPAYAALIDKRLNGVQVTLPFEEAVG